MDKILQIFFHQISNFLRRQMYNAGLNRAGYLDYMGHFSPGHVVILENPD